METTTTETSPIKAVIGVEDLFDATVTLGDDAKAAIRREQIRELHEAQQEVTAGFEELPQLDGAEARHALEALTASLKRAGAAVEALWWLAPDDEPEGDEEATP